MKEVERTRRLLKELGEEGLLRTLDSFMSFIEEMRIKKGENYAELSVLSFIEGMLTSLMQRRNDERIENLYRDVRARREELDEMFRKPKMQNLQLL